ncbi:hypothetical protein C343_05255 [Cryptococcus neoformans C23]|uniref:LYR motif-containing protein Cup1-like N-terminal domain-containing protein n=1 Tax=Cryptococcus neoformans (strain H99 / ATCC 208821 / CBS 10515 / FGSC 9487) TaxID=235443 RepID=J9VZE6_CRYN9|nr:hypothetical protein CNAG_04389 [Cryptococcus neoformans var. grubii H99]AUB27103.1 hypothetical protein CKF44_04389 [Cryptococcus neoformans var. grubii]OWZ29427.1 hypothetical protein C347_05302 [Cryptococcus neoformans var. grubii AD2-60a]OWZ41292.1 hypothetical protein C343_05255 [Cryptococcus neoformans var. grubii C23]OXC82773.1 hypothetical protein C344_04979 [Cryptococcus neoformans var. grubii AD1-7a]OXG29503.1 hypothetical protein C360_05623 [Cryptococcus neoformans var. grubii Bt|eukprot:XP_012051515.1 hypothetical protein CNAG_04389 [Cryptococcus neoformans var. grubii H99]
MLLPPHPPSPSLPRAKLYRLFLQHLRFLPDPQVWITTVPRFRKLLETPGPSPSGSDPSHEDESRKLVEIREWRREKALKKAHKELNKLRAAVACHPHALARLLEESYGQRGNLRWQRLQEISAPSGSILSQTSLPPPLMPLKPSPLPPDDSQARARKRIPACRLRKQAQRLVRRDWKGVQPPLYLPSSSESKDNDVDKKGRTMVDNLRIFAGLSKEPTSPLTSITALDLSPLPSNLSRIFPTDPRKTRSLPLPPYPPPRPKHTRSNPHTWSLPRKLSGRLVRRIYKRLWDKLIWVRPVKGDKWKKCGYGELQDWGQGLIEESLVETDPGSNKGKKSKKDRAIERTPKNIDSSKWSCATPEDRQWLSFGKMQTS